MTEVISESVIYKNTAAALQIKIEQVRAVEVLADEGCTIPFMARYRKERTGGLDEVQIDAVMTGLNRLKELEKRRAYILSYLEKENKLTPALKKKIEAAEESATLEDLYLPFKPRRKTLADRAVEQGLLPLAEKIKGESMSRDEALAAAKGFVTGEVKDPEAALEGALHILVQNLADDAEVRGFLRGICAKGRVTAAVKRGKKEEGAVYRDYFDFSEKAASMAAHRIMAVLRAEREGILNMSVQPEGDIDDLAKRVAGIHFKKFRGGSLLTDAATLSLEKFLLPGIGKEILKNLKEKAERESLEFFARNLERILLAGPFGQRVVIGIDPGVRTGCKCALLGAEGDFFDFLTLNLSKDEGEVKRLLPWIEEKGVEGIAIGDGTFGRETFAMVKELCRGREVVVALVDEDGASVYSAGEEAREEFPDQDVTVRGAISIGRRFQDPMAELVKIDPRSLGVGQYQHDIPASLLKEKLQQTVEWAVNRVGVNLNTAGYQLLSFISGLDRARARAVTDYRREKGPFQNRAELAKVKGIGEKAFQQAAGFLRIRDGENPLDSTGVHPESYGHVEKMASRLKVSVGELVSGAESFRRELLEISSDFPEGESIVTELMQRGLDPREVYQETPFSEDITSFDDLKEGMVMQGVVDNVVAFGAFVDVGLKEKGLVHISEVSDTFVNDINEHLGVGDRVTVKVISLDGERKRIGLSMKQV